MNSLHRVFALATLSTLAVTLSAAATSDPNFRLKIAPGKFDEHCLKLAAGESLRYRFRTSAPVDFNIHYHRGKEIFYPVKHDRIDRMEASFRAPAADDYCLMWENKEKAAVDVEGTVVR